MKTKIYEEYEIDFLRFFRKILNEKNEIFIDCQNYEYLGNTYNNVVINVVKQTKKNYYVVITTNDIKIFKFLIIPKTYKLL